MFASWTSLVPPGTVLFSWERIVEMGRMVLPSVPDFDKNIINTVCHCVKSCNSENILDGLPYLPRIRDGFYQETIQETTSFLSRKNETTFSLYRCPNARGFRKFPFGHAPNRNTAAGCPPSSYHISRIIFSVLSIYLLLDRKSTS